MALNTYVTSLKDSNQGFFGWSGKDVHGVHVCRSHASWAPWDYASPLIVVKAVSQRMLGGGLILWSRNRVLMNKQIYYCL